MERFYKTTKCNWCGKVTCCFMTLFESEQTKYMCDHCKGFINHQQKVATNIDNAVDLWDETAPNFSTTLAEDISKQFKTTQRPDEVLLKQSKDKVIRLISYPKENKWAVIKGLETVPTPFDRRWDYDHLAPAVRRFSSEVKKHGGEV